MSRNGEGYSSKWIYEASIVSESFENDTKNTCLASQHHYLCQAVSILCVHPQNLSFEETVSMVLFQFYPQQVAAFTLAKRCGLSLSLSLTIFLAVFISSVHFEATVLFQVTVYNGNLHQ